MRDNQEVSKGGLVKPREGWNYLGSMLILLENIGLWVKILWHKKEGRLIFQQRSNGQLTEVKMTNPPETADEVLELIKSRLDNLNKEEL